MSDLRLVVFDVDGTLVDSQGDILAAMARAFESIGEETPSRDDILGIVGLSLDVAMARLAPELTQTAHDALVEGYKSAYFDIRRTTGAAQSSPFYPQARETLELLAGRDDLLLGVATGKSKRGLDKLLDKLLDGHGLTGFFVTEQVADFHPSKPHPAMLEAALSETGIAAGDAVMIGDTSYDMEMAKAAGMAGIGVGWGYHSREALAAADRIIETFDALPAALEDIWR